MYVLCAVALGFSAAHANAAVATVCIEKDAGARCMHLLACNPAQARTPAHGCTPAPVHPACIALHAACNLQSWVKLTPQRKDTP